MYRNEGVGVARPGTTRFVATGLVKLRVTPERTGQVLAKLPVNTPLTVLEARSVPRGWLAVRLASEPPMFGYVAAAFVSRQPRDAAAVVERRAALRAAGGHEVVKASLERLADTRAPGRASLMEKLRSMYGPLFNAAAERRLRAQMTAEGDAASDDTAAERERQAFDGKGARSWHIHNRLNGERRVVSLRWRDSKLRFSVSEKERGSAFRSAANGRRGKSG